MSDERFVHAFNTASNDFARLGAHLWNPIGHATVERTEPAAGQRVLDACCGSGASAIPAAHRVGVTGRADAVDFSTEMIKELNTYATSLGLTQLHAHTADVLSWPHSGYDVVQAVLGIFFFPDMAAGTEYLIGRARQGGRVGITIWRRGAMEAAGTHLRDAVAEVTGAEPAQRPTSPIDAVSEAGAFQAWLVERGLSEVTVTTHALRLRLTPELAWLTVTGSGFVAALSGLDEAAAGRVRDVYLRSLRRAGVDELDATTLTGVGTRIREA